MGQLGDGTTEDRSTPVAVKSLSGPGQLSGVLAASTGYYHNLDLLGDGTVVVAWGAQGTGQLGDGITDDTGVAPQMAGGQIHAVATRCTPCGLHGHGGSC